MVGHRLRLSPHDATEAVLVMRSNGRQREPGRHVAVPMMSNDELGGMLEAGPSALYDALAKALGVEPITEAIKRLETRARSVRVTKSALSAQRRALQPDAAAVDDELAPQAAAHHDT
jgi:hypothetical protein